MGERLTIQPENHEARIEAPKPHERISAHAEEHKGETIEERAENLLAASHEVLAVDTSSDSARENLRHAAETSSEPVPQQINRELKQITLHRELQMIRRKLSTPQRALSKVVHQPTVRVVSEAAGKTVSRPSGLLGGGLVALLGTTVYLYLAHHIGFEYNGFVFLILFVGGFGIGLVLELIVHFATASHRNVE